MPAMLRENRIKNTVSHSPSTIQLSVLDKEKTRVNLRRDVKNMLFLIFRAPSTLWQWRNRSLTRQENALEPRSWEERIWRRLDNLTTHHSFLYRFELPILLYVLSLSNQCHVTDGFTTIAFPAHYSSGHIHLFLRFQIDVSVSVGSSIPSPHKLAIW